MEDWVACAALVFNLLHKKDKALLEKSKKSFFFNMLANPIGRRLGGVRGKKKKKKLSKYFSFIKAKILLIN